MVSVRIHICDVTLKVDDCSCRGVGLNVSNTLTLYSMSM